MKLIRVVLSVIVLLVFFSTRAEAETIVKVTLVPFDMHGKIDISPQRTEVMSQMASVLDKKGASIAGLDIIKELYTEKGMKSFDEDTAFSVAESSGADFVVMGSLSLLDKIFSLDWRVMDARTKAVLSFHHVSAESNAELAAKIEDAVSGMLRRMEAALKVKPVLKTGDVAVVTVEGNKRMDSEAVLARVSSKPGQPFSPDALKEDIRAIYNTGYFDDVTADLSDTEAGKKLTFSVKEKPFIKDVRFKGNKNLSEEKLKEIITIKKNTIIDRGKINEDRERIKALYAQDGHYLAEVKSDVLTEGIDATVEFTIVENEKVRVKSIVISGNTAFSARKIKSLMTTEEAGLFSFITNSGSFNEYVFENDLDLIMRHYYDRGHIQADILDYRVLLSEDKKWFYITIALFEGESFTLSGVDITGDILPSTTKEALLEKIKMSQGDVFSRTKLTKGIDVLTGIYGEEGYANAEFDPSTKMDAEKKTTGLTINIRKNDPVYVERIDIKGNVRTRDKVIRRELEVSEGDLFSTSALKMSKNNLKRLGYFEDVNITKSEGKSRDKIKLDVDVRERPTGAVTFGLGYSSVDKLIVTASVSQSNLLGTGLKLDLSGTLGAKSSTYQLSFTEPWLFDRPLSAGFDLFNVKRQYADFTTEKSGGGIRLGFPVYKRSTYANLSYRYENVNITDIAATASDLIKSQEGERTVSSIGAGLKYDTRDDIFFPTEGIVMNGTVELAGGFVGGQTNYVKYEGLTAKYFQLPWDTVFSLKGSVGYIESFGGEDIPLFERYFLGGLNSIRGFKSRTISPEDPVTGELIGGRSKFVFNAEYLFPISIKDSVRGLLFFDAGNAYDGPINPSDMREGAGFGIRWFSPIGPIRLEWGYNLDRKDGEKASLWEFTIGSFF